MPFASSTLITPMCAKPRAAPPPNAKPIFSALGTATGLWGACGGGVTDASGCVLAAGGSGLDAASDALCVLESVGALVSLDGFDVV
jgi:hypothetical protein